MNRTAEARDEGAHGEVSAIEVSTDGHFAVSAAALDDALCFWDLEHGLLVRRLKAPHHGTINAVSITADGRFAVAGCADGVCRVWELSSGRLQSEFTGHTAGVHQLALTPNGREAVSGAADGSSYIWDLHTGSPRARLPAHEDSITATVVSPDNEWVLTGSYDGMVQVQRVATGEAVAQFACEGAVTSVACRWPSPEFVVGDASGQTHFLRLDLGDFPAGRPADGPATSDATPQDRPTPSRQPPAVQSVPCPAHKSTPRRFGMQRPADLRENLERAAEALAGASSLVVTAGAGMGVDSGLPDFRGDEGLWSAYPAFRERHLRFVDLATPALFQHDPELAWGFHGHRLQLYRNTAPHDGFTLLRNWAESLADDYYVLTSNVDGHFQKAGFDANRVVEYHGSIHRLQCSRQCWDSAWDAEGADVAVEQPSFRATGPLPRCPRCGVVARPNLLMFNDAEWVDEPYTTSLEQYRKWLRRQDRRRLVVVESGAGTSIPRVRRESEWAGGTLIRINPLEFQAPMGAIVLPCRALEALRAIQEILDDRNSL